MNLSEKCDNKREDKHNGRWQYYRPRTRPHVASDSLFHHRCAAKLPLRRHLRSGEERRLYNARCLLIRRDGKGPHGACNEVAPRVVEKWVP
jgi:hypothetical protein